MSRQEVERLRRRCDQYATVDEIAADPELTRPQKRWMLRRVARKLRRQLWWPDPLSWAAIVDVLRHIRALRAELR